MFHYYGVSKYLRVTNLLGDIDHALAVSHRGVGIHTSCQPERLGINLGVNPVLAGVTLWNDFRAAVYVYVRLATFLVHTYALRLQRQHRCTYGDRLLQGVDGCEVWGTEKTYHRSHLVDARLHVFKLDGDIVEGVEVVGLIAESRTIDIVFFVIERHAYLLGQEHIAAYLSNPASDVVLAFAGDIKEEFLHVREQLESHSIERE